MGTTIGNKAIVIGAGMAGMPAARVLSDFFHRVIVVESDAPSEHGTPRSGTPQSRHLHVLLAGGLRALETLFPNLTECLIRAGAQSLAVSTDYRLERPGYGVYPQRDLGFRVLSMTRPLLESEVRKRVGEIGNIEFRERCRAACLMPTKDGAAVEGISCTYGDRMPEEISADLIVDATGHGELTQDLIDTLGLQRPAETSVGIDMGYSTATFSALSNPPQDWKILVTYADPPENRRSGFLLPVERNHWMVTLAGRYDAKPPGDVAGFIEYARRLRTPTLFKAVQGAEMHPEISRYRLQASRWRRFEDVEGFPERLLPFGDTICRFNPIYGQGMSVAVKEACLLQELLESAAVNGGVLADLTREFLLQCQSIVDVPWATAVVPDFLDPLTDGTPPANLKDALAFHSALLRLAAEDAEIHKLMLEVQHMLKPRQSLLRPDILERLQLMARNDNIGAPGGKR